MACIIRNNRGEVEQVTADNGSPSSLFESLQREVGDMAEEAYKASNTPLFKETVIKPKVTQHIKRIKEVLNTKRVLNVSRGRVESEKTQLDRLIEEGKITYTNEDGNLCAASGLASVGFSLGGTWALVEDLEGEPSHKLGGVDLQFGEDGVSYTDHTGQAIKAEDGLLIPGEAENPWEVYEGENTWEVSEEEVVKAEDGLVVPRQEDAQVENIEEEKRKPGDLKVEDAEGEERNINVGSSEYRKLYRDGDILSVTEDGELHQELEEVVIQAKKRKEEDPKTKEEVKDSIELKGKSKRKEVEDERLKGLTKPLENISTKRDIGKEEEIKSLRVEGEYFDDPMYQNEYDNVVLKYNREVEEKKKELSHKSADLNPKQEEAKERIDVDSLKSPEDVKKVQKDLTDQGIYIGKSGVDGKLGPDTKLAIDNYNASLEVNKKRIDVNKFKTKSEIEVLQRLLKREGYDIDPEKRFSKGGVDGKLGKVTMAAVEEYNKDNSEGEAYYQTSGTEYYGFMGGCGEKHCSEYTQNEFKRNVFGESYPEKDWQKIRQKIGLFGHAWNMAENMEAAGGKRVEASSVAPGDIVFVKLENPLRGSRYQAEADAAGSGTSHNGIVDQVMPDGTYYILHNVAGLDGRGKKVGREYRTLINEEGYDTTFTSQKMRVQDIMRPNYEKIGETPTQNLRKDVKVEYTEKGKKALNEMFQGNRFSEEGLKNAQKYLEPLNTEKVKTTLSKNFNLEEKEYQTISQLALGILGQETSFGTNKEHASGFKEFGAKLSKSLGIIYSETPQEKVLNTVGIRFKKDEISKGAGQLKWKTNFKKSINSLDIDENNFTDDDKVAVTTAYKLARDYDILKKQGFEKEEAIYRAVVMYNASLSGESAGKTREEWASEKDVDYANKVINLANFATVKSDSGQEYSTYVDDLVIEENVLKWGKKLKNRENKK